MSLHKIVFTHQSYKPTSVGASCKCGWADFYNLPHGGITKGKTNLRERHAHHIKTGA
jgi:hypothetical protein